MVYRSTVDRLSADSRPIYRTAIFWLSTKCRPTIDRVSTNYWPIHRSSIDQLSAKCRWTKSYFGRDTSGTTIDRVSTECRPTIDQLSTAISTDFRQSVDRVSTDSSPSVDRYIDRYIDRYLSRHYPQGSKIHNSYTICTMHVKNIFSTDWGQPISL